MQAKVKKEFKITVGSNADVTEMDLLKTLIEMEAEINKLFPKYRVHVSELDK